MLFVGRFALVSELVLLCVTAALVATVASAVRPTTGILAGMVSLKSATWDGSTLNVA
jgi:hypothetical protein